MEQEKTLSNEILEAVEKNALNKKNLTDEQVQELLNIDLQNLLNTYYAEGIPAPTILGNLKALVDYYHDMFGKKWADLLKDRNKFDEELKEELMEIVDKVV